MEGAGERRETGAGAEVVEERATPAETVENGVGALLVVVVVVVVEEEEEEEEELFVVGAGGCGRWRRAR